MIKLVGVLSHLKYQKNGIPVLGQNAAYITFAKKFGYPILIDPTCSEVIDVDLLLLPGGRDVNPVRYGQEPDFSTQNSDPLYEWFYTEVFPKYLKKIENREMACYGICAGFQNLNVVMGGQINQDIDQLYSEKYRGELVDDLMLVPDNFPKEILDWVPPKWISPTSNILQNNTFKGLKTNSIHHQGVYDRAVSDRYPHTLSDQFLTLTYNKDFGNVETIIHKNLLIAAEQAHPEERLNTPLTDMLINYLLSKITKSEQTNG